MYLKNIPLQAHVEVYSKCKNKAHECCITNKFFHTNMLGKGMILGLPVQDWEFALLQSFSISYPHRLTLLGCHISQLFPRYM